MAFLIKRKRGIADDEDLRAARARKVRSHPDEPFLVGVGAEPVGDGSGLDPGAPNDRSAGDPGSAGDDTFFINVFDLGARADIYAHFLELFLGEGRKIARIARQDQIHRLEQDDADGPGLDVAKVARQHVLSYDIKIEPFFRSLLASCARI